MLLTKSFMIATMSYCSSQILAIYETRETNSRTSYVEVERTFLLKINTYSLFLMTGEAYNNVGNVKHCFEMILGIWVSLKDTIFIWNFMRIIIASGDFAMYGCAHLVTATGRGDPCDVTGVSGDPSKRSGGDGLHWPLDMSTNGVSQWQSP